MNKQEVLDFMTSDKLLDFMNAREGIVTIRGAREQIQSAVFKVKPFINDAQDIKLTKLYMDMNDLLVDANNELAKTAADLQIKLKKELTKNV